MSKKTLYIINQGTVEFASGQTDWDGEMSVLAYAIDETEALHLADLYDHGLLQPDNVSVNGKVISALSICNCWACEKQWGTEIAKIKKEANMKKKSLAQLIGITLNS